jgi:hypothetical protein
VHGTVETSLKLLTAIVEADGAFRIGPGKLDGLKPSSFASRHGVDADGTLETFEWNLSHVLKAKTFSRAKIGDGV